jgi:hypothetical protein
VPSETHSFRRAVERKTVTVASEVCIRVSGEKKHVVSAQAEREAVVRTGRRIEIRFAQDKISTGSNYGICRKAVLLRDARIIAQEPLADVYRGRGGIEQLDHVESGEDRTREQFVNDNAWNRPHGIVRAG